MRYLAGGTVNLSLIRLHGRRGLPGGTANIPGTVAAGHYLEAAFELEGRRRRRPCAASWMAGESQAEPAAWTVTSTDATAGLQAAGTGRHGIDLYQSVRRPSPATTTFDRYHEVTRKFFGVGPPPI